MTVDYAFSCFGFRLFFFFFFTKVSFVHPQSSREERELNKRE